MFKYVSEMFKYVDKQQLLILYIYSVAVQSIMEWSSQIKKKLFC